MSKHRDGGWAPSRGPRSATDREVWIVGHRDFLPPYYPGVAARVFRVFSPRTCTKVPCLTGTTTLSREPTPVRLCRFPVRPLRPHYSWVLSEQMSSARKQPPKPDIAPVQIRIHPKTITKRKLLSPTRPTETEVTLLRLFEPQRQNVILTETESALLAMVPRTASLLCSCSISSSLAGSPLSRFD